MSKPLCIDLFCGTFSWSAGWNELGGRTVGFDVDHQPYHGPVRPGDDLVLQDVLTLDGRQFKDASLILCSPPCQEFSYMAMPWTRAKQIAAALRGDGDFPAKYTGSRTVQQLTALFDACFRIQREASAAAGRHIPMLVENVRGAQEWVGRARWSHGSFALWGDVPALMPIVRKAPKFILDDARAGQRRVAGGIYDGETGRVTKNSGGSWFNIGSPGQKVTNQNPVHQLMKEDGIKSGGSWFGPDNPSPMRRHSSKSSARKAASAFVAKIPPSLSDFIAWAWMPKQ